VDDLFTEPGARLPTTIASPPPTPRPSLALPVFAWVTPLRATVTVVVFLLPTLTYQLGWKILAYPAAAVAVQCLRRWHTLRWTLWSLLGAALAADVLALGTWPLRFAACLLLIGPIVFYAGAQLRDV
jgi:hypothetical protein